jgi:hypothetical protein
MRKSRWLLEFSPDTLNLYSPVRMKNGSLSDLVNFSCMVKFSKQYLDARDSVNTVGAHSMLETSQHLTLGGGTKICGKHQHSPHCFGLTCSNNNCYKSTSVTIL